MSSNSYNKSINLTPGGAGYPSVMYEGFMRIFLMLTCLFMGGCGEFLDIVLDSYCNEEDGPLFTVDEFPDAVLNQEYSVSFKAHIPTRDNDDDNMYYFDFDGELPQGIRYTEYLREITVEGTPTELGTFRFNVEVEVSDRTFGGEELDLCYKKYDQDYSIGVVAM